MTQYLLLFSPLAPLIALFGAQRWLFHQRRRQNERAPVSEKMLRPPGYFLSLEVERRQETMTLWLFSALLPLALVPWVFRSFPSWVLFGLFALVSAVSTMLAFRTGLRMREIKAGIRGEQLVAEQLSALLPLGCRVFHDLDTGCCGNIDHVVVGDFGVFALETKYRRKRTSRNNQKDHCVMLENDLLRFPRGVDRTSIAQTRRGADWLAKQLSRTTSENVKVEGVLVFPGWFVERKSRNEITVLSGKEIPNFFKGRPAQLTALHVERIASFLDERCRDVAP